MHLIVFLLVGLIAGWLGSVLVHGRGLGLIGDLIIGVIGAFLGGIIFRAIGLNAFGLIGEILQATAGAVALLALIKAIKRV